MDGIQAWENHSGYADTSMQAWVNNLAINDCGICSNLPLRRTQLFQKKTNRLSPKTVIHKRKQKSSVVTLISPMHMPCHAVRFPMRPARTQAHMLLQSIIPKTVFCETKISYPAIQLYTSLLRGLPCPSPKSYLRLGAGSRAGPPCHGVPCPSMSPLKLL
jgi:hypothetical protein